jgi:D-alanyl-D-alanine-carboxypeptidase/D-alanyl-D-alanine-endopeptidase
MLQRLMFTLVCALSQAALAASPQKAVELGLRQFVEAGGVPGLAAAFVTPQGVQYYSFGAAAEEPKRVLDEHSEFAVASISKLFTTLALSDLVREGKLRFEDTVDQHLSGGLKLPGKGGKTVTLANLATHTSGIPTDSNWAEVSAKSWDYALKHYYQKPLVSVPGANFKYNNLGMALLGHVGELVDGRPYEEMVQARVLRPLGMRDTWVTPPAGAKAPMGDLKAGILAPAGGFSSNAVDLAKFAAAALGGAPGGLDKAFEISFAPQGQDEGGRHLHLGWHQEDRPTQLNHTGRNNIYLGIDLKRQVAMVILCTDQTLQIGGLGHAALVAWGGGKSDFPKPEKIVTLSAEELQAYTGEYRMEGAGTVQLKADPKRGVLLLALDGKGESVLWPGPDRSFHCKEWHCDLSFTPATGKASQVKVALDSWSGNYLRVAGK